MTLDCMSALIIALMWASAAALAALLWVTWRDL